MEVKNAVKVRETLEALPRKIHDALLRRVVRAAVEPIQVDARSRIHTRTGRLKRGVTISTRMRGGVATATVSVPRKKAFYAAWVEEGHLIGRRLRGRFRNRAGRYSEQPATGAPAALDSTPKPP